MSVSINVYYGFLQSQTNYRTLGVRLPAVNIIIIIDDVMMMRVSNPLRL
jgi:hypothetical protein